VVGVGLLLGAAFGVLYIIYNLPEVKIEVISLCFLQDSWIFEKEFFCEMKQILLSRLCPSPILMFLKTFYQGFSSGEPLFA
jgi:hypothetical protein